MDIAIKEWHDGLYGVRDAEVDPAILCSPTFSPVATSSSREAS